MLIRAYATLRDLLRANRFQAPLAGPTPVGEVLARLAAEHPGLHEKLWDAEGQPTGYVMVLLNGRSVEYLQGMATLVSDDDTVSLFPPVGGG